ncbi:MAG TPA: pyridoxamine 5'-phosphate oxidase family protein [Polyangiaceae bacterium]|jgi:hypothetical protein
MNVARALVAKARRACLATLDASGAPYASLVLVADDGAGNALLLLSDLAEHTKNSKRDPRASLLVEPSEPQPEPLAAARVTLVGTIARIEDESARAKFLATHPSAATYAAFEDFAMYRLTVDRAHLVAGFGKIEWLDSATYSATES